MGTAAPMVFFGKTLAELRLEVSQLSRSGNQLSESQSQYDDRLRSVELEMSRSRSEVSQRFGTIERQIDAVAQSLARIEASSFNPVPPGPIIASSSTAQSQVPRSTIEPNLDVNQLGYRYPKVEIPVFNGRMPYGWICRIQRLFRHSQYAEEEILGFLPLCLEGDVLDWYNAEVEKREFMSWRDFQNRLLSRFASDHNDSPSKELLKQEPISTSIQEAELRCEIESDGVLEKTDEIDGHESHTPDCVSSQVILMKETGSAFINETILVPKEESPVVEALHEKSGANVALSKHSGISRPEYAYQLRMRTKRQRWSKSWRFKFKHRAKPSAVTRDLHNQFFRSHKLHQRRKKRISPTSWWFQYKLNTRLGEGLWRRRKYMSFGSRGSLYDRVILLELLAVVWEKKLRPEQDSYQAETSVYPQTQVMNWDPEEFKAFDRTGIIKSVYLEDEAEDEHEQKEKNLVVLMEKKTHKLLHFEAGFWTQYNDLERLSTELQSFSALLENDYNMSEGGLKLHPYLELRTDGFAEGFVKRVEAPRERVLGKRPRDPGRFNDTMTKRVSCDKEQKKLKSIEAEAKKQDNSLLGNGKMILAWAMKEYVIITVADGDPFGLKVAEGLKLARGVKEIPSLLIVYKVAKTWRFKFKSNSERHKLTDWLCIASKKNKYESFGFRGSVYDVGTLLESSVAYHLSGTVNDKQNAYTMLGSLSYRNEHISHKKKRLKYFKSRRFKFKIMSKPGNVVTQKLCPTPKRRQRTCCRFWHYLMDQFGASTGSWRDIVLHLVSDSEAR